MGKVIAENKQEVRLTPDDRKITCGEPIVCTKCKGNAENCKVCQGKGFLPKSLGYFNVTKFPEIMRVYGEKPTKLLVTYPPFGNNIDDFMTYIFGKYNALNRRARICDRENFYVKYDQEVPKNEQTEDSPKEYKASKTKEPILYKCLYPVCGCNCLFMPQFFVLHKDYPKMLHNLPIHFKTGSEENAAKLNTQLRMHQNIIQGLIFEITVEMVVDGQKKFPSMNLKPIAHVNPQLNPADFKIGAEVQFQLDAGVDSGIKMLNGSSNLQLEEGKTEAMNHGKHEGKCLKEFESPSLRDKEPYEPGIDTDEIDSQIKSNEVEEKPLADKILDTILEKIKTMKSSVGLEALRENLKAKPQVARLGQTRLESIADAFKAKAEEFKNSFTPDDALGLFNPKDCDVDLSELK